MYKKIILLVCITLFVNCSDTTNLTNCIRSINLSTVTDLNNPSMINAQSKYSVDFGGAPQTDGFECPAIEYKVTKNGSTIRISNF